MKRILLASVSIVAFAGAAAAQDLDSGELRDGVTFGGDATFGYNEVEEGGFFLDSSLAPRLSRTFDSGIEAGVLFSFDIANDDDDEFGNDDDFAINNDFLFFIEAPNAALFFGDTKYAAETHWSEDRGPGAVGDMAADGFSEQSDEVVLRGTGTFFANVETSISYNIADDDGDGVGAGTGPEGRNDNDVDQLSLGASGAFGAFSFSMGYQQESDAVNQPDAPDDPTDDDEDPEEDTSVDGVYDTDNDDDFNTDEIFAVSVGSTFSGVDAELGYATNTTDDQSSLGVQGSLPVGPVIVSANYVFEFSGLDDDPLTDDDESDPEDSYRVQADYANGPISAFIFHENEQGDDNTGVEATYDIGNGLSVNAGLSSNNEDNFIAGIYQVDESSTLLISYAEAEDAGAADYKEGTTMQISFDF